MNELKEKLARRRYWEEHNRPQAPPPPILQGGGDGNTPDRSKSAPIGSRKSSFTQTNMTETPPSVPSRTYRSKEQWKKSNSQRLSSRSLRDLHEEEGTSLTSGAFQVIESPAVSTDGAAVPRERPRLERSGPKSSGSLDEGVMAASGRLLGLTNSGSSRHLMMQMERINNKVSPPGGTVPRRSPPPPPERGNDGRLQSPRRAPPPPPGGTAAPSGSRSPTRAAPPPPTQLDLGKSVPVPVRTSPPPPHRGTSPLLESSSKGGVLQNGQYDPGVSGVQQSVSRRPPSPLSVGSSTYAGVNGLKRPALPPAPPKKAHHQFSTKTLKAIEEMSHLRPTLQRFYAIHNPANVPSTDKILAHYGMSGATEGEEKLNEALRSKYNADLKSIDMSGPAPPSISNRNSLSLSGGPSPTAAAANAAMSIVENVIDDLAHSTLAFAKAKFKFDAEQEGDLGFDVGQIIEVTDSSKEWWTGSYKGEDKKERRGVFPRNYVEEISEAVVLSLRAQEENLKSTPPSLNTSSGSMRSLHKTSSRSAEVAKKVLAKAASARAGLHQQQEEDEGEDDELSTTIVDDYSPELVKDDIFVTHYFKSVMEVVTSEFKYVTDLYLANHVFVTPMYEQLGRERTETMMPSWRDILRVHEQLLFMLIETIPDIKSIEANFGNEEPIPPSASGGISQRRSSHVLDSALAIDKTAGASSGKLKEAALKLDAIDEVFSRLLESGRLLTLEQREQRDQLVSTFVQKQCAVLLKLSPFLKTANVFISNYHNALEVLESFSGEDLALLERLEADPLLKNLKLRDFLIKPVQRVCKYPLLLREVIKYARDEDTKVLGLKCQTQLMSIADQVNTMMKLNESGNAKKLALIKQCIRPQSDVEAYELHKSVLRREGDLSVVKCYGSAHAPDLKAMTILASQLEAKPKGSVRGLLFQDQLLLVEVNLKFITRAERLRVVLGFSVSQNWDAIKIEKVDQDAFTLTLCHSPDGPAKGATVVWMFRTAQAARDGWVEDLAELSERMDKVRERVSLARQQEMKAEKSRRRSGSIDWDKLPAAPARPARAKATNAGTSLSTMIDELKNVQSSKLEHAKMMMV